MVQPVSIGQGVPAYVYDGATLQKQITPRFFRYGFARLVGLADIWTPTAGKKFRLQSYFIEIMGNAYVTGAGVLTVTLYDSGNPISGFTHDIFLPGAGVNLFGGYVVNHIDLGNGYLSSAANNVLRFNMSIGITPAAAFVRVNVCGIEE